MAVTVYSVAAFFIGYLFIGIYLGIEVLAPQASHSYATAQKSKKAKLTVKPKYLGSVKKKITEIRGEYIARSARTANSNQIKVANIIQPNPNSIYFR